MITRILAITITAIAAAGIGAAPAIASTATRHCREHHFCRVHIFLPPCPQQIIIGKAQIACPIVLDF